MKGGRSPGLGVWVPGLKILLLDGQLRHPLEHQPPGTAHGPNPSLQPAEGGSHLQFGGQRHPGGEGARGHDFPVLRKGIIMESVDKSHNLPYTWPHSLLDSPVR
jgi:hypothetical protein